VAASSRQEPNAGKRRTKPVWKLHGENIPQTAKKQGLKILFVKKVSVRCPSYGLQEIFKRMQNPLKLRFSQFGLFGGDYHQHSFKCGQFQSVSVEHCGLISGQRNKLVLVCLIAYALFIVFVMLSNYGVISSDRLYEYITYLQLRDYIILAAILLIMAVLISGRFMRSIFKSSDMGTYREEA
jgi:hypothetical protein